MFAQYGPTEQWGKWSPSDDLIYLGRTDIADAAIALPDGGNEVSMLAPLALLGGGGLGAGAAAGVAGVAALGSGGGGSSAAPVVPTVTDPTSTPAVGGPGNAHALNVTGAGAAGDEVVVTVGGETATTTIGTDGTWSAVLTGETFPADGEHATAVVVNHQGGGSTGVATAIAGQCFIGRIKAEIGTAVVTRKAMLAHGRGWWGFEFSHLSASPYRGVRGAMMRHAIVFIGLCAWWWGRQDRKELCQFLHVFSLFPAVLACGPNKGFAGQITVSCFAPHSCF